MIMYFAAWQGQLISYLRGIDDETDCIHSDSDSKDPGLRSNSCSCVPTKVKTVLTVSLMKRKTTVACSSSLQVTGSESGSTIKTLLTGKSVAFQTTYESLERVGRYVKSCIKPMPKVTARTHEAVRKGSRQCGTFELEAVRDDFGAHTSKNPRLINVILSDCARAVCHSVQGKLKCDTVRFYASESGREEETESKRFVLFPQNSSAGKRMSLTGTICHPAIAQHT